MTLPIAPQCWDIDDLTVDRTQAIAAFGFTERQARFLHIFGCDRIEFSIAQRRREMHANDHVFSRNGARLLPIGPRVAVEKSRRELFNCRHLLSRYGLFRWIHQPLEQDPFAAFGPPCSG